VWVVDHVATELRDPDLEMSPVLSVKLYVSVVAEESYLAVVVGQDLHLDNFSVNASFNLETQLAGLKYFDSRWVNARRDNIAAVG